MVKFNKILDIYSLLYSNTFSRTIYCCLGSLPRHSIIKKEKTAMANLINGSWMFDPFLLPGAFGRLTRVNFFW